MCHELDNFASISNTEYEIIHSLDNILNQLRKNYAYSNASFL